MKNEKLRLNFLTVGSPIGTLTLAGDENAVANLWLPGEAPGCPPQADGVEVPAILQTAAQQLREYFLGERKVFDVPLNPAGGPFFQRVWEVMRAIPYGQTMTYSRLAGLAGNPRAARAAGMACNRNPIPIFIPCHRVVGADGSLTGFRSGLNDEKRLLELEGAL